MSVLSLGCNSNTQATWISHRVSTVFVGAQKKQALSAQVNGPMRFMAKIVRVFSRSTVPV
jgi:hypothetical protein